MIVQQKPNNVYFAEETPVIGEFKNLQESCK